MSNTEATTEVQLGVKRIDAYSLVEFCQKVQDAVLDGYRLDLESNENVPTSFGTFKTCGMLKENLEADVQPRRRGKAAVQ